MMVILIKLVLISGISVLILTKTEKGKTEDFPQQTWSVKDVIPAYWFIILISSIWHILYKSNPIDSNYIFSSFIFTFLATVSLFYYAQKILNKKSPPSLEVIGAKISDLYLIIIIFYVFNNNYSF